MGVLKQKKGFSTLLWIIVSLCLLVSRNLLFSLFHDTLCTSQGESKGAEENLFFKTCSCSSSICPWCVLVSPLLGFSCCQKFSSYSSYNLPTSPLDSAYVLQILFHARSHQLSLSFCSFSGAAIINFWWLILFETNSHSYVRSSTGQWRSPSEAFSDVSSLN